MISKMDALILSRTTISKIVEPASDHYWSFSRHPKEGPKEGMYLGSGNDERNDTWHQRSK
jgi:hypothetical protein